MKISTRTRYGLMALFDIALNYKKKPATVKDIAKRQNLSEKYLEQILLDLKRKGFVQAIQGPKGGFVLAKDPKNIKLIEVFSSLEGPISFAPCIDNLKYCKIIRECGIRKIWVNLKKNFEDYLSSISLMDIIKAHKRRKKDENNKGNK